jgi:hypothetical protein
LRLVKSLKLNGFYLLGNEIFCARPERLLSLHTLLYNGFFLVVKSGWDVVLNTYPLASTGEMLA